MPSTDIDGSPIVILNEAEARRVYYLLQCWGSRFGLRTQEDRSMARKISRDLGLPELNVVSGEMKV